MSDHTETEHVPLARPTAPNPKYWAQVQNFLRAVDSHIVEGENRRFKHGKLMEKLEDTSDVILAHELQLNLETGLHLMRSTRARLLKELQQGRKI